MIRCETKVYDGGFEPVYMTKESACADLALPEDIEIQPGRHICVGMRVGFDIPYGCKMLIYPRSSLLIKYGLMMPTGIIDSDYKYEEVHAVLVNLSDETRVLTRGTRVMQVELQPFYRCDSWSINSEPRAGGIGSTGDSL